MSNNSNMPLKVAAYLKGVGITKVTLDDKNNLIFTMSNGKEENVGALNVDDALSDESRNPVQNMILTQIINAIRSELSRIDTESKGRDDNGKQYTDSAVGAVIRQLNEHITTFQGFLDYANPQLARVESGSVVTDNTSQTVIRGSNKPVSGGAVYQSLNGKVDKVDGMGLSTNDYTNEEKAQVERVRNGSVVVENTLSALDETSNKPVSGKGIAEAIKAAVSLISNNIGQIDSHKTVKSGNLIVIVGYTPYRQISSDTIIKVIPTAESTIKGVSISVIRDGSVKYIPLSKANDFYYFQAIAGDEVVNLYVNNGGEVGEVVKVQYIVDGSIAAKVDSLEQDSSQYRVEINAMRENLDVLVDEAGLHTIFQLGNLIAIVEYTPYRQISGDIIIKVTPTAESTIKGVSITLLRDGSTKYMTFSKANGFFYFQAIAGDEIVNLYVNNGGEVGEVVKVQYATDFIRWMAIGDSLTSAYTLGESSDNYVSLVAKRLGIVAINKGVGGSGYWKNKNINNAFFQRIPTYTEEADVITIFGSFNDLGTEDGINGASVMGDISDTTTDTICGCINATLDAIEEYYPKAIVGIITPTPWSNSHASINPESYVTKLKEIAEYRSIPCLDLFHSSNLRPWDESFREMFYLNKEDGAHPNTLGHKRISGMIANFMQSIVF